MKHLLIGILALLAVALAAPAADAGKKTIKIKKPKAVAAGLVWTETGTWKFDMTFKVGQQAMPFQESRTTESRIEVLAASSDRIDKLQVTYTTLPSGDPRSTQPYLVAPGSAAPVVTATDGRTLAKEEIEKVMSDHGDLVRRTPLRSWLIGKTFKKGKRVKAGDDVVRDLFGGNDESRVDDMVIIFQKATKKVAVFRFEADVVIRDKDSSFEMQATVTGGFEVDLQRGLLLEVEAEMQVDGPIEAGGQKMWVTGSAAGTRTFTYTDPP